MDASSPNGDAFSRSAKTHHPTKPSWRTLTFWLAMPPSAKPTVWSPLSNLRFELIFHQSLYYTSIIIFSVFFRSSPTVITIWTELRRWLKPFWLPSTRHSMTTMVSWTRHCTRFPCTNCLFLKMKSSWRALSSSQTWLLPASLARPSTPRKRLPKPLLPLCRGLSLPQLLESLSCQEASLRKMLPFTWTPSMLSPDANPGDLPSAMVVPFR